MAESSQEKTEQPTSKRLNDARKKGQIFQSKDASTVVVLFGVFWILSLMLPQIYSTLRDYMLWILDGSGTDMGLFESNQLFVVTVVAALRCILPPLLTAVVLGILSHGVQTRFNVSFSMLAPNFGKLNPLNGIKRIFSFKNVFETLKGLLKSVLIMFLLYNLVIDDIIMTSRMVDMNPLGSAVFTMEMIYELIRNVCLAFTVIAFFDYLFQRYQYQKDMKMTKQEVKDEFKNTEGNPEIKGRIRRIQRQMALSRMMQKVPQADVVIKNPTHFAVALKYDPHKNGAPLVLAKGQDHLALRIIKEAEEHGVAVVENKPLARALYAACKLDREIPSEFYGAVAEILVYIYKMNNRQDMLK